MAGSNYLQGVKDQYEDYPYPRRDPNDEKTRLLPTDLELLDYLNFKCFEGKQNYSGFRALVAGGGTGDAAIFLAEQLRDRDAEIVYLDISHASRTIAEERARIRGLENITWVQASILDIPELDIGVFDYINCSGVLHHLESPVLGLNALRTVLREGGCMGLMLYATIGRTAVYQMQELLRLVNSNESSIQKKIDNARTLIEEIPQSNWLKLAEKLMPAEHIRHGDAGIYDAFLHEQDRSYTVPEMLDFVSECDLEFTGFSYDRSWRYRPESYIKDATLLKQIKDQGIRRQYAISELVAGNILVHMFYVSTRRNTTAQLTNLDNIPYFYIHKLDGAALCREMQTNPGRKFTLSPRPGSTITITPGKYTHLFFKYLDGDRSLRRIFKKTKKELGRTKVTDNDLLKDFEPVYKLLNEADWLLLRGPTAKPIRDFDQLQAPVTQRYQS
jgi:ubiquinone/menaquinone biosynthesis C-methylase UbiE